MKQGRKCSIVGPGRLRKRRKINTSVMQICIDTCPHLFYDSFMVESSCSISRLISEMETTFRGIAEVYGSGESWEEICMLMFEGTDLLTVHPSRTLDEIGVKNTDWLIIRDKRSFSIKISMQMLERLDKEVRIEVHDTIQSLRQKIKTIFEIPVDKQRLCYVGCTEHHVITDDSISLIDYGIMKKSWESEVSDHKLWLHNDIHRESKARHCSPMGLVGSSSSFPAQMEIVVQFYSTPVKFLYIAVKSHYTVNQLLSIIQETEYMEICMLVFKCKNLLEHGSYTLGDLGIKDQDKLFIPIRGPFNIVVNLPSSSFRQQEEEMEPIFLDIEVEATWILLKLKEMIEGISKIPVKKQRLCFVRNEFDAEECHVLLTEDSMALGAYGIQLGTCIGLCVEDDSLTVED